MASKKKEIKVLVKTDLVFGEIMYIRMDPKQEPYELIEYKITPDGVKFRIANIDGAWWLHDFQLSLEPDALKRLKTKEDGDDDDED